MICVSRVCARELVLKNIWMRPFKKANEKAIEFFVYYDQRKLFDIRCILRRRADTGAFASGHSAAATDSALISYFPFNHYNVVFCYTLKQGVG